MNENTKAKYSKTPVFDGTFARFPRALMAIAKVSVYGAKKHDNSPGDLSYLDVPEAETVYLNAEARHLLAGVVEGPINAADGDMLHKAQKAWNALADLEVFLYQKSVKGEGASALVSMDFTGPYHEVVAPGVPNDWDSGQPATPVEIIRNGVVIEEASDPEPL